MVPGGAAWRGFDSVNVQMQSSPILASVPLHSDSMAGLLLSERT